MSVRFPLVMLPAVCGALRAQAPAASLAATSPAHDDSIYALRVDPAEYRGHGDVLLLDDGTVRVEAGGRSSYTLHQVVQLLTTDGVKDWGELTFWYTPGRQRVRIHWIRVIGEDGSTVHEGPAHQQEVRPPAEPGAPVFSDRRAIEATLAGLAPGVLIDYSFTLETLRPRMPGDFLFSWYVNGSMPVRRSRFTFDAPADLAPHVRVRNFIGNAVDSVVAGRRIRRWATDDVPGVDWQRFGGTPNGVVASIRVSGDRSWRDVAAWYDSLSRGRDELTPEILAAQARELRGAKTLEDSLRATYRWVAQDFRYVSLSLGDGGYRPRPPREVYETRFGDCKDKATLLVSLARRMGLVAYPVLVNSDGDVDSLLPSVKQFDHMIAAVEQGGRTRYLDATSTLTPYDEVPPELQGEVGLALRGAGARVVVLPASAAERNRRDEEIVGAFGRDGRFVGRVTVSASGTEQYDLRQDLAGIDEQNAATRDKTLRAYALSVYRSSTVDSTRYADGRDLTAPARVTVWFTATNVLGRVGEKYYFNLPLSRFGNRDILTQLDREGARRFPIDVAQVNSPSVWRSSLEVELPEGWKAELPADVSVEGPFGYYRATYSQKGRLLRASREMGGLRGLLPPDSLPALREWVREVAADRATMIVLNRGTGDDLVAAGADTRASGAAGTLPEVVLGAGDLSDGAKVKQEGEPDEAGFLLSLASTRPLETFQRDFGAEQMVFTAGHSRLAMLQVTAVAFHTAAEARRPIEFLDLVDLHSFLGAYFKQITANQASLGASREVQLDSIGDRAEGWVMEFVTPMTTLDIALVFSVRGRVALSMLAIGPHGLQDGDVAALLRTMDDRVRRHEAYLRETRGDDAAAGEVATADSALASATAVALDRIAAPPRDTAGLTTRTATFGRVNGWPTYRLDLKGKGLTFGAGGSSAIQLMMSVTLHHTEEQALGAVISSERNGRAQFARGVALGSGIPWLADSLLGADSTSIEAVPASRIGSRSRAFRIRMRGAFRMDVDAVVFARGRLTASIAVLRPPGASDPAGAIAMAQEMLRRMRSVMPEATEAPPPAALVAAIGRVVDAERAVDSLVEAKDFDGAFRTVERARLSRAPVGFSASTWNGLCWYASLAGQARRAMPACEAAVAPDPTIVAYRDSRGLARALTGDLDGARDDFAYCVTNAPPGEFHDTRAAWLAALHAGENPFTPEVLEQLRGN